MSSERPGKIALRTCHGLPRSPLPSTPATGHALPLETVHTHDTQLGDLQVCLLLRRLDLPSIEAVLIKPGMKREYRSLKTSKEIKEQLHLVGWGCPLPSYTGETVIHLGVRIAEGTFFGGWIEGKPSGIRNPNFLRSPEMTPKPIWELYLDVSTSRMYSPIFVPWEVESQESIKQPQTIPAVAFQGKPSQLKPLHPLGSCLSGKTC